MEKLKFGAERLGIELGEWELASFQTYYDELIDWNRRINLTSITEYEQVQINHFLDALTVTLAWKPGSQPTKIIDVGTGGGIPGVPLKIAFPQVHLTLLDSTAKKANFLRQIVEKLELKEVDIVIGRAEEVAHQSKYRERYDIVVSRAVAELAALSELTLPFCIIQGQVILHKKGDIRDEIKRAENAIDILGGKLKEVKTVTLPEFTDNRCLVVIEKITTTPEKYPRRAGIPTKRPIH